MGLKQFLGKKKSEHPIIEAQRETHNLFNNSKSNLFSLKITVLLDLAWSTMGGGGGGGSNLLHPPILTYSVRGQNHSSVPSKFTFSHNCKKTIFQKRLVLER